MDSFIALAAGPARRTQKTRKLGRRRPARPMASNPKASPVPRRTNRAIVLRLLGSCAYSAHEFINAVRFRGDVESEMPRMTVPEYKAGPSWVRLFTFTCFSA
jgi:hypothetical protein